MPSMPALGTGTLPSTGTPTLPSTGTPTLPATGTPTLPATGSGTMAAANLGFVHQIVVPSYATVSVQSHVPTRLEMKAANYTRWAFFFKSMCGKFCLRHHIDGSVPPRPQDPAWDQADCCVRSWIFGSVDDSVLSLVVDGDHQTARDLWVAVEGLFRTNQAPRAIFHLQDFHTMTQGDSTIDEYAERMKKKAADLRDVGHVVVDSQLVLNLLRGVNTRFTSTANDIANSTILPDFSRALDLLKLKELRLANEDKTIAASALIAATSSCSGPGGCRSTSSGSQQGASGGGGGGGYGKGGGGHGTGGGYGKKKKKGGQQPGNQYQAQQPNSNFRPTGPWFCFNPLAPQGGYGQQGGSAQGGLVILD